MSSKIIILTCALKSIEDHLAQPQTPQEVAADCHYSLSGLQKLFSQVLNMGVADYISRRRITAAARDLLATDDTVLTIALRYGFASHEVFIRSFRRVWGETPSHFRHTRSFADVFPPFIVTQGGNRMPIHHFDTTQLYDAIRQMDGTYAIIFDTSTLTVVNDTYGTAAGDLVIAECLRRIDLHKQPGMLMFRFAGDEYILLTGLTDETAVAHIAAAVLNHNGECIQLDRASIPVSMHHAITQLNAASYTGSTIELRRLVSSSVQG